MNMPITTNIGNASCLFIFRYSIGSCSCHTGNCNTVLLMCTFCWIVLQHQHNNDLCCFQHPIYIYIVNTQAPLFRFVALESFYNNYNTINRGQVPSRLTTHLFILEFHDADTDTDIDILARMSARMSVSVSVSASWNGSFIKQNVDSTDITSLHRPVAYSCGEDYSTAI